MAQLTLTVPSVAGVAPTANTAAAGGDLVANYRGKTVLRVINGGGSSINVTLVPTQTNRPADGQFPAATQGNVVIAVPAGGSRLIGPIPTAFNDANGNVPIAYSAVTSVTVEAIDGAAL